MSNVTPPPMDAFDELKKASKDPWYTAVIYEAHLEHVDEAESLWRVPYFGQVVRVGTAEQNFKDRKRGHETDSISDAKVLGFHSVIGMFGSDKIAWTIVDSRSGPRTKVQEWANAEEIRLIAEHGGVLRDMDAKLKQTLNLTNGGQCRDAAARWASIDAVRRHALTKFKAAMETFVEVNGHALVPQVHIDADGYRLGSALNNFRQGMLWKGMPELTEIVAWAEALPKWAWDARETDEYRKVFAERGQERRRSTFAAFKTAMEKYVEENGSALVPYRYVDDDGYKLGSQLSRFREGHMRNCLPEKVENDAWAEALPKWSWNARETDEFRENVAQSMTDYWTNMSQKDNEKRGANISKGLASRRRAELERARLIAVPFEKSKKRRLQMLAACTNSLGKNGKPMLYMVSNDGLTIRRVTKQGNVCKRFIVGPVVDPEPSGAFDTDSD